MRYETEYRVIFDDPDKLDEPTKVLVPAPEWMYIAMNEGVTSLNVWWAMEDAENKAIEEGRATSFRHDPEMYKKHLNKTTGPLTEEQAIEYLCLKDLPRKCWSEQHNRPMFKIVKVNQISSDRTFRNAWEMVY